MISSMTGFGSAEGKVGSVRVSIELRTVHHRFFNPSIKLPAAFSKWEGDVREMLRQQIVIAHLRQVPRDSFAGAAIDAAVRPDHGERLVRRACRFPVRRFGQAG
jgi:hypothetical protein